MRLIFSNKKVRDIGLSWTKTSKHVLWRCRVLVTIFLALQIYFFCLLLFPKESIPYIAFWAKSWMMSKPGLKVFLVWRLQIPVFMLHFFLWKLLCFSLDVTFGTWLYTELSKILFLSGIYFKLNHISSKSEGNSHKNNLGNRISLKWFGHISLSLFI